jgi:hypothetical protein
MDEDIRKHGREIGRKTEKPKSEKSRDKKEKRRQSKKNSLKR